MQSNEKLAAIEALPAIEALVLLNPEIAGFQSYEYLQNNNSQQKQAFIDGDLAQLDLAYPDLENAKLDAVAHANRQALVLLMGSQPTEKTEALYRTLEYRYSEMYLIDLARKLRSDELSAPDHSELLEEFRLTSESLYGKPEKHIFNALAERNIAPLLGRDYVDGSLADKLQTELSDLIGNFGHSDYQPYVADPETLARLHDLVVERFESLVDHIDIDKIYDTQGMVEALNTVLIKIGGSQLGWKVVVKSRSSALAVSAHQKLVEVGENRTHPDGSELRVRAIHEICIHALRSIIAEKADWLSAAYGQDGYLPFEEGAATALEDAYKGIFDERGADYYLIAGLGYGLDDHEPRNFREAYEIMWRINALRNGIDATTSEEAQLQKARSKAFVACIRMYRGTSTIDRGVLYLKDLAYFNGQELAWSFLDGVSSQQDLDLLFMGKLDLTRPDHLEIAHKIQQTT